MSATKDQLMKQLAEQAAVANARKLVSGVNDVCFEKCVPKPSSSLSSGEEKCFTNCMEKFMSAWNSVSRAYVQRLQEEQMRRGGGNVPDVSSL